MQVPEELELEPEELMVMLGRTRRLASLRIGGTVAIALPNILRRTYTAPQLLPPDHSTPNP